MLSSDEVVRLSEVSKAYRSEVDTVQALDKVSLSVRAGEILVVMGVSGSGKSTLIGIIAGLLTADSGEVSVAGVDLRVASRNERSKFRRTVASMVFQEFNLVSLLTVTENVALPLESSGVGRQEAHKKAIEALEVLGLADKADKFPGQLSGGQRQRVAIARALAGEHRVILADEPTGALDSATAQQVREALVAVAAAGKTVIVATHDPMFLEVAARSVRMLDGRLEPGATL